MSSPMSAASPAETAAQTPGSQAYSPTESASTPRDDSTSSLLPSASTQIQIPTGPFSVAPNGKIALPPKSQMPPSTAPAGPASRVYQIPPRPKPGRKPKEPTADDARKEQNRAAQKKFRNKQHDKIQVLTEELDKKNSEIGNLNSALAALQAQMEAMRQQLIAVDSERAAERASLKRQAEDMQRESKRMRMSISSVDDNARTGSRSGITLTNFPNSSTDHITDETPGGPTPPYEMEIDFTNFGQPTNSGLTDDCGFCNGGDFCACAMKVKAFADNAPDPALSSSPIKKESTSATAPGTCERCLADPEQARKCQELAKAAHFSPSAPHTTALSITTGPNGLLADPATDRTSCSDFLAKFRPLDQKQYRSVIGRLHTFPHIERNGGTGSPFRPALDIDAKEAAEALTSLAAKPKRR